MIRRLTLAVLGVVALLAAGCRTGAGGDSTTKEGGISSLGLPGPAFIDGNSNIMIQELWIGGVAQYLIANVRPTDATVTISDENNNALVPPVTVPAGQRALVAVPTLQVAATVTHPPVYAFSVDGGTSIGVLRAPTVAAFDGTAMQTIMLKGLNGFGLNIANGLETISDGNPVAAGAQGTIRFMVAQGMGDLHFAASIAGREAQLPQALVVSVTSDTYTVSGDQNGGFVVSNPSSGNSASANARQAVDVTYVMPTTATGPLAELAGTATISTSSSLLSFGIPVAP